MDGVSLHGGVAVSSVFVVFLSICWSSLSSASFLLSRGGQSLFPSLLDPSFPYPSFNVRDLDTVDQGVREHMSSFVRTLNNTLLVMHELGVDHCGHRCAPPLAALLLYDSHMC